MRLSEDIDLPVCLRIETWIELGWVEEDVKEREEERSTVYI